MSFTFSRRFYPELLTDIRPHVNVFESPRREHAESPVAPRGFEPRNDKCLFSFFGVGRNGGHASVHVQLLMDDPSLKTCHTPPQPAPTWTE